MSQLELLDTSTIDGATSFMESKDAFKRTHGDGCTAGTKPRNWKPSCIAYPWFADKLKEARHTLKMNVWQMSYKEALKIERELKFSIWEKLRNNDRKKKSRATNRSNRASKEKNL